MHNFNIQVNANDVFNEIGIVSWSHNGFLASLDRQGLSPAAYDPNEVLPIVPIQARSLFITLSVKF